MVAMWLLVMVMVAMVWQVWLEERQGCGEGESKKNGGGYCETFAIFNS